MPTDKEVQEIAGQMDAKDSEKLIQDAGKGDYDLGALMKDGLAAKAGLKPEDFDPKQLEMGIRVETEEHSANRDVAQKIAMDHLAEYNDYYTALDEMEKKLESEGKARKEKAASSATPASSSAIPTSGESGVES